MRPVDDYTTLTLDDGFKAYIHRNDSNSIVADLRVYTGAWHEKEGEEGLTHLLEHVWLMGGSDAHSVKEIDMLQKNLLYINASTTGLRTSFNAEMLQRQLDIYLDVLANSIFQPKFDDEIILQEKRRILREMAQLKTQASYDDITELVELFYRKHPLHTRKIIGKENIVKNASKEDLYRIQRRIGGASNMDLVLVGNLPDNAETLIKNAFMNRPSGERNHIEVKPLVPLKENIALYRMAKDLYDNENPDNSLAEVNLLLRAPSLLHPDAIPFDVMHDFLGQGPKSVLFDNLSNKAGITYNVSSKFYCFEHKGLVTVVSQVDAQHVDKVEKILLRSFQELQEKKISTEEFDMYLEMRESRRERPTLPNWDLLYYIRLRLETGISMKERNDTYARVTREQIQKMANKYLPGGKSDAKYALLIRDPLKENV